MTKERQPRDEGIVTKKDEGNDKNTAVELPDRPLVTTIGVPKAGPGAHGCREVTRIEVVTWGGNPI